MPIVYRRHGDGGSQENFLFRGIKACFKTSDSIMGQRPSSDQQQETDRMSPGSLPRLQREPWSTDGTWLLQGARERALTLLSPARCWSCCSVPSRSRLASPDGASLDTPVWVTHTQHSHSLRQLLRLSFQMDVCGWAAHGSSFRSEELWDISCRGQLLPNPLPSL